MKLLVVEDNSLLRRSLMKGLREAGCAVDATGDGNEGLWYAQTGEYDAVILDIMLPGMDGLTILQKLRKEGNSAQILLLTAKDTVSNRVTGLDLGADDYLVKPFAFEELVARVRAMLRHRYDRESPVIHVADVEINTSTRVVTRSGAALDLSPREYALLEYMASRAGEIVTRTEIEEHLYDFNQDVSSNVVNVYVLYLRRKLEENGQSRLIHTKRGEGYVMRGNDE